MEFVQRAIYSEKHPLSGVMYDRVHASDGNQTYCGKALNEMWFIVRKQEVTCKKCLSMIEERK